MHSPRRFDWERVVREVNLPSAMKLVLLVLATYMRADGTQARPSVATLARNTGLSERTVRRHLSDASERGYLERTRRGHGLWNGAAVASEYRAGLPQPDTDDLLTHAPQPDTGDLLTDHTTGHLAPHNRPSGAAQPATSDRPSEQAEHSEQQRQRWIEDEIAAKRQRGEEIRNEPGLRRDLARQWDEREERSKSASVAAARSKGRSLSDIDSENEVRHILSTEPYASDPELVAVAVDSWRSSNAPKVRAGSTL